ncbi:hypothetical protein ACUXST_000104 [Sphingomonas sp. F9_3S_D5_B_2]
MKVPFRALSAPLACFFTLAAPAAAQIKVLNPFANTLTASATGALHVAGPAAISIEYNADGTPVKPLPATYDYQFLNSAGNEVTQAVYWTFAYAKTGTANYTLLHPDAHRPGYVQVRVDGLSTPAATFTLDAKVHLGSYIQLPVTLTKVAKGTPPTPTSTPTSAPDPITASASPSTDGYASTLVGGFTPKYATWLRQTWTVDMGSTWTPNMDYSWRSAPTKSRFELHDTVYDRGSGEATTKRRAELHDKQHFLKNDVPYWGAITLNALPWSDPAGMAARDLGVVYFQMHMPKSGSPVFAFRRGHTGLFTVTTNPGGNVKRYSGTLSFGQPHDIVYRTKFDLINGELDVWVDGRQVVSYRGNLAADDGNTTGYYPCYGLYAAGGVAGTITSEVGNVAHPTTTSLLNRVRFKPSW